MLTRRTFFKIASAGLFSGIALGSYAFGIEPLVRLKTTFYRPKLSNWPNDLKLRIAVLTDIHACKPWMPVERIRYIVRETNRLNADIVLLLGDYTAGMNFVTDYVHSSEWAPALGELRAPLGIHAVLGNHDYWEDLTIQRNRKGKTFGHRALEKAGIKVYENDALLIKKGNQEFWLAGLGDQLAFMPIRKFGHTDWRGKDDLPALMSKLNKQAPVILMAHEPDIFDQVAESVALTVSGHTHGGQVRFLNYAPINTSGQRLNYGMIQDGRKHLIVSGGLGCSMLPVRFGTPPEIVVIETA